MADRMEVQTFAAKQEAAKSRVVELRERWDAGYGGRAKAAQIANLERVANFDRKITAEEIVMRVRSGTWK